MSINPHGEIIPFDDRTHNTDALARDGLLFVATAMPPFGLIYPGVRTAAMIDEQFKPRLDMTGVTVGDADSRIAAGRLLQQISYRTGLRPGSTGLLFDTSREPEILASPTAKRAAVEQSQQGYIGYFALVGETYFTQSMSNVGQQRFTRSTREATSTVGVTLPNLVALLGAGGLDSLIDPAHHPHARLYHAAAGLRLGS